jgi:GT2 family glycosyltransferase
VPASAPRVAIAIVAWKGADLTIDCLRSIASQIDTLPNWRVYVVDNASPDDSADRVEQAIAREQWGAWVTFIRSDRNG